MTRAQRDRRDGANADIHAAVFLEVTTPQPVVLFEMVKGWLTGANPDLGEMHHLKEDAVTE